MKLRLYNAKLGLCLHGLNRKRRRQSRTINRVVGINGTQGSSRWRLWSRCTDRLRGSRGFDACCQETKGLRGTQENCTSNTRVQVVGMTPGGIHLGGENWLDGTDGDLDSQKSQHFFSNLWGLVIFSHTTWNTKLHAINIWC